MTTPRILFNGTTDAMHAGTLPRASANELSDYVISEHCEETVRATGDRGYWVCTRDRNKPHMLHIAVSDDEQKFLCAKWEYVFVIHEEPTLDDAS